jgi:hypothetical protein
MVTGLMPKGNTASNPPGDGHQELGPSLFVLAQRRQFLAEIATFPPPRARIGLPSPVLLSKYAAPELAWAVPARNGLPM